MLGSAIDFVPRPETVLRPDVAVVDKQEADQSRLSRAPMLLVEVVSPSSRSVDLGARRYAYADASVPRYWVVDPEPPIELVVFELVDSAYQEVSRVRGAEQYVATLPFPITVVSERLHAL